MITMQYSYINNYNNSNFSFIKSKLIVKYCYKIMFLYFYTYLISISNFVCDYSKNIPLTFNNKTKTFMNMIKK